MMLPTPLGYASSLVLICLGALTGCAPREIPPHAEWTEFTTSNGRITAKFPFPPKTQTETEPSALGNLKIKMVGYETADEALMVSYVTFPADPATFDVDVCLEASCTGAFPDGTFLEKEDLAMSGFPGKASLVRDEGDIYARTRICLDPAGPMLVQAMCFGSLEFVNGPDVQFFLDSVTVD